MSKRPVLDSRAPYERICTGCTRVRPVFEFVGTRRICTSCANLRMFGVVSSGGLGGIADSDHYDGAELRPFTGRPGAMDAFALPSLRFGERVYRRAAASTPLSPSTTTKELP